MFLDCVNYLSCWLWFRGKKIMAVVLHSSMRSLTCRPEALHGHEEKWGYEEGEIICMEWIERIKKGIADSSSQLQLNTQLNRLLIIKGSNNMWSYGDVFFSLCRHQLVFFCVIWTDQCVKMKPQTPLVLGLQGLWGWVGVGSNVFCFFLIIIIQG